MALRSTRAAGAARPALAPLLLGALLGAIASPAPASTLLDETRTVATGVAPVERTLTLAQAGALEVEVTDRQVPAPLAAIRAVVTRGDVLVGTALTAAGRIAFDAAANTQYTVRVYGRPAANQPFGLAGVRVTRAADPQPRTPVLEFVALFETPPAQNPLAVALPGEGEILSFPEAGSYTVTFTDHEFPAPLAGGEATIARDGALGSPLLRPTAPTGTPVTITVPSVTAPGGPQYRLFLRAAASSAGRAALFSLRIVGGSSNTVVYERTFRAGDLAPGREFTATTAGDLTLQLRDGGFPAALPNLRALLTAGSRRLGAAAVGAGSVTVSAPAGPLTLWTYATAGTQAGFLEASVRTASGTTLDSVALAVPGTAVNSPTVFVYPFDVAAPGTFRARVTDFQSPSVLPGLTFAVVQNGAALVQSQSTGTLEFAANPGRAFLFAGAQVPVGGSGLFSAEVFPTATPAASVLERTQAVGLVSETRILNVTAAGRYDFTLRDLGWPANFPDLSVAVTRGGQLIGRIFSGGTFFFDDTGGQYLVTVVARPAAADGLGLYSLAVRSSPPTATIAANPTTVPSGQTTQLTWSSTGATTCTALGGWSGTKAASGTEAAGPLTANQTYSVTCTGPAGSATASVNVTVTPPSAQTGGGGGGGGSFGLLGLALLGTLAVAARGLRRGGSLHAADSPVAGGTAPATIRGCVTQDPSTS